MARTTPRDKNQAAENRAAMVAEQIAQRGVNDSYVLEAMSSVPRENFMMEDISALAYEDMPMPIGENQTISQPYIVALMAQLAELHPTDKVLEIGTGSGYGAAVLSCIVKEVYTIERHKKLAEQADATISKLGYDNITVVHGDGSGGLPDEAPYDAIIVTAGAPGVPEALQEQLAIGGRLIIPAGENKRYQHMLLIRRIDETTYKTEDHGAVAFVPLIGQFGWPEKEKTEAPFKYISSLLKKRPEEEPVISLLKQDAEPLPAPDNPQFGEYFDRLAEADIVLLGESTHGTAEFYNARAAITQRLIRNHGFKILALEADWPDTAILDGYIRNRKVPHIGKSAFSRFPEWMWRNQEFRSLVHWLRKHNDRQENHEDKAGIYGLDLYNLHASVNAILDFLEKKNPDLADIARKRYSCFEPWLVDPASYGRAVITADFMSCEKQAVDMLTTLQEERASFQNGDEDSYLDIIRNAKAITTAEQYYRIMYLGSAQSWNLRDRHMFDTLRAIIRSKGPYAKAIVWAHNSHIGDARATQMGRVKGEINLGQLCREQYGDKAALVGFGTAAGKVAAADSWGGPTKFKTLKKPIRQSFEELWQKTGMKNALLDIRGGLDKKLQKELDKTWIQRAIGVVYLPVSERASHYIESHPGKQFDYYVWLEKTHPVTPLTHIPETGGEETYPFGL